MKTLLTVLLLAVCLLTVSATSQRPSWEYKFEYKMSEKKANDLAAEGWELIIASSHGSGPASNVTEYVFRRPK